MGEVVDLARYRRTADLRHAMQGLVEAKLQAPPCPTDLGWRVLERVGGEPVSWQEPRYRAVIGYVPGRPEWVYLRYDGAEHTWEGVTIAELIAGLETGLLPSPS